MAQPTSHPGLYCRRCGYDLRSRHESLRCPECGREFDPSNPRTFLHRPPRAYTRWLKRLGVVLLSVLLILSAGWGWLYWGWRSEQAVIGRLGPYATRVKPLGGQALQRRLGA